MSKLIKEFKEFALKGNVVDMAIGVIIGGAFGKIVTSLVEDIIMPLVACLLGNVDFTHLAVKLKETVDAETGEVTAITWNYGNFIQIVINFIIIALCLFAVIKAMNKMKKEAPAEPEKKPRLCPFCKSEIAEDATRCPHCTSELK